jgi:prepilin peptidase CpaA
MSTCDDPGLLQQDLIPRPQAWRIAVLAPLVLAVPWVLLCRAVAAPGELGTVRGLLVALLLLSATVTDLRRRRIYNWTTYTVLGWAFFVELAGTLLSSSSAGTENVSAAIASILGALPWRESLAGFGAGFAIMFVLYNVFRGGAGDLKLVAVLGALVGPSQVVEILIYTYILAGILAACLLVGAAGPRGILALLLRAIGLRSRHAETSAAVSSTLKTRLPMAPFIAAGSVLALTLS